MRQRHTVKGLDPGGRRGVADAVYAPAPSTRLHEPWIISVPLLGTAPRVGAFGPSPACRPVLPGPGETR